MTRDVDAATGRAVALVNQVEELVRDERPRAALQLAEEAVRACEHMPDWLRAAALHARGRAHDALGDLDAATTDLNAARDLEPRSPARWMLLAQLVASRAQWDESREMFLTAIDVADAVGERDAIPQAHWELANIARVRGDVDLARHHLAEALAAAEELGDVGSAAHSELTLADLEAAEGNTDVARNHYARARSMADLFPAGAGKRVTTEPQGAPPTRGDPEAAQLPAPQDVDPVLRIVLAPRLGENVELELWPGGGLQPLRRLVPFRFAIHPRTEERLRWYIEEYPERPIDPAPAIAGEVEEELEQLGEALFDALLGQPASEPVRERVSGAMDRLRVEIVADTLAADALPWELLRDPTTGTDLALTARSFTRTTTAAMGGPAAHRKDEAIRILLVIARPEGRLDVPFRSIAEPLLRELTAARASAEVDVLRPPTFEQLQKVLRDARSASRPYDLVHFDGHGLFDPDHGGGALVFESGDETAELVTGERLGKELVAGAVPLLVLNACRSAASHQGLSYGSVARGALESGLAAVVAMRFNVYVATAAVFVGGLYRVLGEGRDLQEAVANARRLLTQRTDHHGLPAVRDWCVPTVYQTAPVRLAARGSGFMRATIERALPPEPRHGFVGRDEVFVEVEAALVRSPTVVLRALPGQGKTTLATEFARWYVRTGGCGRAGPLVSLADRPTALELRERLGGLDGRPLLLWDDTMDLSDEYIPVLDEIARVGGRTLVIRDRRPDPPGLPVIGMPNFPDDEAQALALAVAADAGAAVTPELAREIGGSLRGHALAIELAVQELANRGGAITQEGLEELREELRTPENGSPAPWTRALGDQLDIDEASGDAALVAQCRGYVSVICLGLLRGDEDYDSAASSLEDFSTRGFVTHVGLGAFAIHPGLPAALAAAGRYTAPGQNFVRAVARTASAWTGLAELKGGQAPWPAEAANVVAARRLASREGWWPEVVQLMEGVVALAAHGAMVDVARTEILDAASDFVVLESGEPLPGMEEFGEAFLGHLAWVAEMDGDRARVVQMRIADVAARRAAAEATLLKASEDRTDADQGVLRRLGVGLTNLGRAQLDAREPSAHETMTEAIGIARGLGDWRLEALNRLNLGVYWMTVPPTPDFDRAEDEFDAGYKLAIEDDPGLAGKLMTERGTLHYEKAMRAADPGVRRGHLDRAAELLELAVGLREPDAVLFHQLGQVHRFLGHLGDSRAWFEQAIALRDFEREPGGGADARLHLALTLEDAGLLDEALRFARSAEEVLARATDPDPSLQVSIEGAVARLALLAHASAMGTS